MDVLFSEYYNMGLYFVAENGYQIRGPKNNNWQKLNKPPKQWMEVTKSVIENYRHPLRL